MTVDALQQSHGYVEAVGGVRLHYRAWEGSRPRGALMVLHGLADHSGRYEEFGRAMARYGIATYALDLRGHGLSEGRRGYVARFEVFLQDTDRFRREVQGLIDPSCPIFLLGHGMGGLIALRYLEQYESHVRGAVLVAPWLASMLPLARWKTHTAALLSRILPALPLQAPVRAADLSHDDEIVRAFTSDPVVHPHVTPRLLTEASAAMGLVMRRADRLTAPLLFLLPGSDRICDSARSAAFARSLPARDVTIRTFPGLYHDLLNEIERHSIRTEIREWIGEHLTERETATGDGDG